MRVVGLDLSLTAAGLASITHSELSPDDTAPRPRLPEVPAVDVRVVGTETAGKLIRPRSLRLRSMADEITQYARTADLVVIEEPAYGATGGAAHDRSGLWWLIVARLDAAYGIPVVEVTSPCLKVYTLGTGRGDKDKVLTAVVRRYGHLAPELDNNNEADALALADMGARYFGQALVDLPQTHTRAMKAPQWPTQIGAR